MQFYDQFIFFIFYFFTALADFSLINKWEKIWNIFFKPKRVHSRNNLSKQVLLSYTTLLLK